MRLKPIVLLVSMASIIYVISIYFIIKESNKCDEHVVLDNKEEYDCRHVSSFSNGMSSIKFCDGAEMTIPTNRIVKVTNIEK